MNVRLFKPSVGKEELANIEKVLDRAWLGLGPTVSEFENEWVHMRKSNTEPIIRIYAESQNEKSAHNLGERFVEELKSLI